MQTAVVTHAMMINATLQFAAICRKCLTHSWVVSPGCCRSYCMAFCCAWEDSNLNCSKQHTAGTAVPSKFTAHCPDNASAYMGAHGTSANRAAINSTGVPWWQHMPQSALHLQVASDSNTVLSVRHGVPLAITVVTAAVSACGPWPLQRQQQCVTFFSSALIGPGGLAPWSSPCLNSSGRSDGFWGSSCASLLPITREPAVPPTTCAGGGEQHVTTLSPIRQDSGCNMGVCHMQMLWWLSCVHGAWCAASTQQQGLTEGGSQAPAGASKGRRHMQCPMQQLAVAQHVGGGLTSASGGAVLPSSLAWMASTTSCRNSDSSMLLRGRGRSPQRHLIATCATEAPNCNHCSACEG